MVSAPVEPPAFTAAFTQAPAWVRESSVAVSSASRYAVVRAGAMNAPAQAMAAVSVHRPGARPAAAITRPRPAAKPASLTRAGRRQSIAPPTRPPTALPAESAPRTHGTTAVPWDRSAAKAITSRSMPLRARPTPAAAATGANRPRTPPRRFCLRGEGRGPVIAGEVTNAAVPKTISRALSRMPAAGGARPTSTPTRAGPETYSSSSATPSRL